MDRLDNIGASAARLGARTRRSAAEPVAASEETGSAGCALVPVHPIDRNECSPPSRRPTAAFLAHLIATAQNEPQTRGRRRAEPVDAAQAYEQAQAEAPTVVGGWLSRAM